MKTEFSVSVEVQAPPQRVWAVMHDIERWPEWTWTVRSVERLDAGPLAIGSRALIRQPKLIPARWEVTELDEGRSFTWITRSPGVRVTATHGVKASPSGSRATLSLRFSGLLGPLAARLTGRLTKRYLSVEAEGLRERSEGKAP